MIQKILNKLFSARYFAMIALVGTFCALALQYKVSIEAFIVVLMVVLNYYFKREDRNEKVNS